MDVRIKDLGTVWVFDPLTDRARAWCAEHVNAPDYMRMGEHAFGADWRPGRDIAEAMAAEGFAVEVKAA